MPVNIDINLPNYTTLSYTGLTSGNGRIVAIPDRARNISVTYVPTSAGTASIKYGVQAETPTDFTDMPKTSAGDFTATGGQEIQTGARWVGLDPASGTWTLRVSYKML
jgi:hypothetical protein